MFETEEIDVDYFTPASSTSLSKIFSSTTQNEDEQDNRSLKYTPIRLPKQVNSKPEEEKPTQHVLCVVTINAHEWLKDSYVSKEMTILLVIVEIIKSGLHHIILYDSNKTILSCLTLTSTTEINVKENVSISFYDNQQKYWSVYTNPCEINRILDILKGLNVHLKYSLDIEKEVSKTDNLELNRPHISIATNQTMNDGKESNTDSSVNRRTKDSILKRMATMGQSVLPPTHLITQSSDSSDTDEAKNQHRARHKPLKTINKRNIEKNVIEIDNTNDSLIKKIAAKPLSSPEVNKNIHQNTDQQIVAMKTVDIIKSPINSASDGNNMTIFMSEQRVSNSELRINMCRMTDKIDLMLEKVNNLESVGKNSTANPSQLQNEITYKLLNEYEIKIKSYEAFIKSKGYQCDTFEPIAQFSNSCNINSNNIKENKLSCNCKQLCEAKDTQITQLKEGVQTLTLRLEEKKLKDNGNNFNEINELKENITIQKNLIDNLNKKLEIAQSNEDVINKLKSIMNETFQTISNNFDSNTSYTGAMIKSTVASVIKKTTMDCLKDL